MMNMESTEPAILTESQSNGGTGRVSGVDVPLVVVVSRFTDPSAGDDPVGVAQAIQLFSQLRDFPKAHMETEEEFERWVGDMSCLMPMLPVPIPTFVAKWLSLASPRVRNLLQAVMVENRDVNSYEALFDAFARKAYARRHWDCTLVQRILTPRSGRSAAETYDDLHSDIVLYERLRSRWGFEPVLNHRLICVLVNVASRRPG